MSELAVAAWILGGVLALLSGSCLAVPGRARAWVTAFPRHRPSGWVLACTGLIWAGWLLYHMPLGGFDRYKSLLYVLTPAVLVLVVVFMDELLPVRALGGMLLLVPAPLLDRARWQDTPARLVVTVIAYLMVVDGMILVLSPHMFRRSMRVWIRTDTTCRILGGLGALVGVLVLVLAAMVY